MALILRTWPEYKKDLKELERDGDQKKNSKSPFIYVRDKKTNTRISCKQLRADNPIDISKVFDNCILTEQKEWAGIFTHNEENTKTILRSWLEIEKYCKYDWPLRMKAGAGFIFNKSTIKCQ